MFLIRDVFRCKPGKAGALARMFLATVPSMEKEDGFRNVRVMTDAVADYWTVVLQAEVEDLAKFEGHMRSFGARPEVKAALAGYMDLVDGGHREIYRIVE
jgi:quinol monooxygenase YgiN